MSAAIQKGRGGIGHATIDKTGDAPYAAQFAIATVFAATGVQAGAQS